jgi:hypothetical protein
MVSGRGSHRPEEQLDPGVGANRQPAGGTKGPRLRLGLLVWCGLPVGGQGGGAIMLICNTAAMNHHLCEISSQVAADAHAVVILDGASWHNSHGLGAQQYHFVGAAAAQPGAQSSGAGGFGTQASMMSAGLGNTELASQWLRRSQDGVEPVRRRSRLDPLALHGRLGSGFVRSIAAACYRGLR